MRTRKTTRPPRLVEMFGVGRLAEDAVTGGDTLFTLDAGDATYVAKAPTKERAIVMFASLVGREYIKSHSDQVQRHLSPVIQVDRDGDIEELDPKDVKQMPPPVPTAARRRP